MKLAAPPKPKRKSRPAFKRVLNLDEHAAREIGHEAIDAAEGVCEMSVIPRADSKTLQQLRYFHGPVLMTICRYQEAQGEKADPKRWKRHPKRKCLNDPDKWYTLKYPSG